MGPSANESNESTAAAGAGRADAVPALLDRVIRVVEAAAIGLVLPVSLLLFLQWPLREYVHAGSREANDVAQWLFAVYVSVAVTYATRRHAHLATDTLARRYPARVRVLLARIAAAAVLVPWSLFLLVSAWPTVARSVAQLESFPETYDPGYFIVKAAVALLAALVLIQALLVVVRGPRDPE